MNGTVWLSQENGKYIVDRKSYNTYDEAVMAVVQRIPAGLDMRAYDDNQDGWADRIVTDYW